MTIRTAVIRRSAAPALLVSLILALLSGCATTPPNECQVQAAESGRIDLATHYHRASPFLAFGPLPRGMLAQATVYRVNVNRDEIRPCEYLKIHKELYLRRDPYADLTFTETREFYAQDGTLIASHSESLGQNLRASGFYTATTLLPIPPGAPAGNYLIVSKLFFHRRGYDRSVRLARAEVTFTIEPRHSGATATPSSRR